MKLGITGKMVMILLATSSLLVVVMAVTMNWSFQKGFLDYLTETELNRLDDTVERLANAYRREGSWEFIRHQHRIWASFLPHNLDRLQSGMERGAAKPDYPSMPGPSRLPAKPGMATGLAPPPPPNDRSGLSTRLRLLDVNLNNLIGPPDRSGNVAMRPIDLDGEVIGWLSLTPQAVPSAALDRSFRDEQLDTIYPIAIGALILALLLGIPLGRHLLKPVKEVVQGTRALARGDFETRLAQRSSDELGRLALDFNTLAEALQRNELLRRQGMADISHELRTPLALLRGEIEAMQDGIRAVNDAQLDKLHQGIMQLNHLVDDLYDLALTDAGALNYNKTSLNLAEVLRQSAASAEHRIKQQHLTLNLEIPGDLPVFGDARRLRQVADNLLKNSRRYTDPDGIINLSGWKTNRQIHFKIEDSAPGVDRESLAKLFNRFYREEGSRNRISGGAGLGLAICRNIVDAHQGEIIAKPSPLGGLQIVVTLPMD